MVDIAGEWISAEFQRLAEVLSDYDPYLALEMVPLAEWGKLIDKSKVFRVIDTRKNQIVLYADSLANPRDILARVWGMDQKNGNVVANLDLQNKAAEALQLKERMDEMEAAKDFAGFVFKNKKNFWIHEGRKRSDEFKDLGPVRSHIT